MQPFKYVPLWALQWLELVDGKPIDKKTLFELFSGQGAKQLARAAKN